MSPEIADAAHRCLAEGGRALIGMYTDTALLLNSCDVAARAYATRTDEFQLSTTQNIPTPMRLPVELDIAFHRTQLPDRYTGPVLQRIAEDFAIRMISVIDGTLEDVYESTLQLIDPTLSEAEVSKRVRSAWQTEANGHVKLLNYLTQDAGLVSPVGKQSTVQMVFDRYYEMREIRHALVHTAGILSAKHLERLRGFSERLPADMRHGSLASAEFLAEGRVIMTVQTMLTLRHWAYTTVFGYLRFAFSESAGAQSARI